MRNKYILKKYFVIVFLVSFSFNDSYATEKSNDYGLKFLSHYVNQDQRTGLDLTPNKSLDILSDEFTLSFQIKLRREKHTYGYVFRLISKDESSFDFISHLGENRLGFVLTNKGKPTISETQKIDSSAVKEKWVDVKFKFTPEKIIATFDKYEVEIGSSFKNFNDLHILFGSNKHLHFSTTDVAPISVKNIEIHDKKNQLIRHWALSQHLGDETYDLVKSDKAIAVNGVWEIDSHYEWSKIKSLSFSDGFSPQIAEDTTNCRVFVATQQFVYIHHLETGITDTIHVKYGMPYIGVSRRIIYDSKQDKLISYALDMPMLNIFDFKTGRWTQNITEPIDKYQHQNHMIDQRKRELIAFGGYGRHMYVSSLSKIGLENGVWVNKNMESISPRYLSAMGLEDENHILVLGGYGSESGKQEEWPHNFYDLYRLNIDTYETTKLWEYTNHNEHYTFSNSMVVNSAENKIYALAYNNDRFKTYLQLYSFDIKTNKPSPQILGDSISFDFLDIKSYSTLFFNSKSQTFYALVLQGGTDNVQTVEIYSLAFPPIAKENIIDQIPNSDESNSTLSFYIILISVVFLLIGSFIIYNHILKTRTKKGNTLGWEKPDKESSLKTISDIKQMAVSSINLIGGFKVIDKDGINITSEFTPTLKSVFLFLLLNSIKQEKGTTSQQLDETFWSDMDKDKAVNNRSVNVRRLRLIIEKIGDLDIVNKSGYWLMTIGEGVTCDYKELMDILNQKKRKEEFSISEIDKIIDLASGDLLPAIYDEWLDKYKSDYSILITETLISISKQTQVQQDYNLLLKISDIILANDSIDEDAIKMKVEVLYKMKKKGLSKKTFDQFHAEYQKMLGTYPSFTYEEIINK